MFVLFSPLPSFPCVFSSLLLCPLLFLCLLSSPCLFSLLLSSPSSPFISFYLLTSSLSSSQVSEATAKQKPKTEFCFGEFFGETRSHAYAVAHNGIHFIYTCDKIV